MVKSFRRSPWQADVATGCFGCAGVAVVMIFRRCRLMVGIVGVGGGSVLLAVARRGWSRVAIGWR